MKTARYLGTSLAALALLACAAAAAGQAATPRRLVITVAQDANADGSHRAGEVSGGIRSAPQVRIYDSRTVDNVRVVQTVQVLEGRRAYVLVGQSRPVPDRQVARSIVGGRLVEHAIVDGVEYRDANTGFYVTPRLTGDRVTLDISPQRDVFVEPKRGSVDRQVSGEPPPGTVDTQRVTTTVSGRLGEWIEVARHSEERGSDRSTVLGRAGDIRSESRSVLLKVEEVR